MCYKEKPRFIEKTTNIKKKNSKPFFFKKNYLTTQKRIINPCENLKK